MKKLPGGDTKPTLSICIVGWNVAGDLRGCLHSLYEREQGIDYEVIVVDNGSRDGTLEMLRREFPQVLRVENRENRGFGTANNQGIRLARGGYVLFLNPDTLVHPGALAKMVAFLRDRPGVGVVGPKLLSADGSLQPAARRFPGWGVFFHQHTPLKHLRLFKGANDRYKMKDFCWTETAEVEVVSGAALLIRREALGRVQGFDEGYFMFFEEIDLCRRVKESGYQVFFLPEAVITHLGGRSRRQSREDLLFQINSLFHYLRCYEGQGKILLFSLLFKPLFALNLLLEILRDGAYSMVNQLFRGNESKAYRRWDGVRVKVGFLRRDLLNFWFRT